MSWRAESTFRPSTEVAGMPAPGLTVAEKEFMKVGKRLKGILKIEEAHQAGEQLQNNQIEKMEQKESAIRELGTVAREVPGSSTIWERYQDLVALLSEEDQMFVEKNRQRSAKAKPKETPRREPPQQDRDYRRREPEVEAMPRHERPVVDSAAGEGQFFTCSADKLVLRWVVEEDTNYLRSTCTYGGHEGAVWGVGLVGDKLISGGASPELLVYDPETPARIARPISRIPVKSGIVRHILAHPDDPNVFATHQDQMGKPNITVWDLEQRCATFVIEELPNNSKVKSLQFGLVGRGMKLFSGHEDGTIAAWDVTTGARIQHYRPHTDAIVDLKFYPKNLQTGRGPMLLTASLDQSVKVIDLTSSTMPVKQSFPSNRPLRSVVLVNDYVVFAGGHDPMRVTTSKLQKDEFHIFVYTMDGEEVSVPGPLNGGHFGPIHQLRQLPGQPRVISVGEDGGVKCINVPKGTLVATDVMGAVRHGGL